MNVKEMIVKHFDVYVLFAIKAQRTEVIRYVNKKYKMYNISNISE